MNDTELDDQVIRTSSDDLPALLRRVDPAALERAVVRWNDKVSRLSTYQRLTEPQQREFDAGTWLGLVAGQIRSEQRSTQLDRIRSAAFGGGGGGLKAVPGAFGDTHTPQHRGTGVRDDALRLIDSRRDVADEVREAMATAVDKAHPAEIDRYARFIRAAGTPEYESAFGKLLADPTNGHREFDDDELRAFRTVQAETRGLNLTDANGGYLVPATVNFQVMLTNSGSVNPLRKIARHETTTTDTWSGITSAGASASWDAEQAEVSDDSPTFAQPTLPVHKAACYITASFEVAADANIGSQLAPIFADARDQLEATAFTLGTGSGQPTGIITGLVAAGGGSVLTSAGSALTVADVTANQNALSPRWRPRARWMMNLSIINQGRQLIAGTGLTTPLVVDGPNGPSMMGWPVHENSIMDGTIAAGTTADYVLLSGDFNQFVVVDRIGLQVVPVPVVFGTNRRPTGETGWYAYWRTGSTVLIPDAFRITNYSS